MTDSQDDLVVNFTTGTDAFVVTITRNLDTGDDAEDFVIPAKGEWTLGWGLNKSTNSAAFAAEHTGSLKFGEAGATYLAGLTASGLAALALIANQ